MLVSEAKTAEEFKADVLKHLDYQIKVATSKLSEAQKPKKVARPLSPSEIRKADKAKSYLKALTTERANIASIIILPEDNKMYGVTDKNGQLLNPNG